MKFSNSRDSARQLGNLIAQRLYLLDDIDFVTYVPTSSNHVRKRGFDHALLIAQSVAKNLDIPLVESLQRQKNTRQFGANRFKRKRQIKGVFRAVNEDKLKGKKLLLVDDVISTGATIEEAAKTLKQAQIKRIYVAVAAHNR